MFLLAIMFAPACQLRMKISYGRGVKPRFAYVYENKPVLMGAVHGNTVASDAWTSYMIASELGFRCVVVPVGHSAGLVDVAGRSRILKELFSSRLAPSVAESFLRDHGVGFVLVNLRLAHRRPVPFFERIPEEYSGYRDDWAADMGFLTDIYRDEDVVLYQVAPE
jgi:hypothetical protein